MSIVKVNPTNQEPHTRLLNEDTDGLSVNAFFVFHKFTRIHPDATPTDDYMSKLCCMGIVRYKKAKKELKDRDLLITQRTGGKGANIVYHIGSKAVDKYLISKSKNPF